MNHYLQRNVTIVNNQVGLQMTSLDVGARFGHNNAAQTNMTIASPPASRTQ